MVAVTKPVPQKKAAENCGPSVGDCRSTADGCHELKGSRGVEVPASSRSLTNHPAASGNRAFVNSQQGGKSEGTRVMSVRWRRA